MNEHQNVFYFTRRKTTTQNFSSLSPPKLIYSPVGFVCRARWRIQCYNWSDRLSIKLCVNGQLCHNQHNFVSAISIYVENLFLLDLWSNFHKIRPKSSSDHAGKNVWISCQYAKWFSLIAWCQTASDAVSLQSFDILTPNFTCVIVT